MSHPLMNYGCLQPQPLPYDEHRLLWTALRDGALIGASGATAVALHGLSQDTLSREAALRSVLGAAAAAGVANVAATSVAQMFGARRRPLLGALAAFTTATAVAYMLSAPKACTTRD
ncbi:hypothetical protein [Plasticicumulans acidivorans]|uniref:Uncharacterized protein n=1 Tax=Plasticicumulans acidivorans TaxID=886464 RepID=A0A317MX53_9GAMM|nr:hypothetical protein [Plasticicumulans acidivorans]PWV63197.1 hypothetical protein C7443_103122 [Plasticicumulans acidivorans]